MIYLVVPMNLKFWNHRFMAGGLHAVQVRRQLPKLSDKIELWLNENCGPGTQFSDEPWKHEFMWSAFHHIQTEWNRGKKIFHIKESRIYFTDSDHAMLFKLTFL